MRFKAEVTLTVGSRNLMSLPPSKFHYKTLNAFSVIDEICIPGKKTWATHRSYGSFNIGRRSVPERHLDLKSFGRLDQWINLVLSCYSTALMILGTLHLMWFGKWAIPIFLLGPRGDV